MLTGQERHPIAERRAKSVANGLYERKAERQGRNNSEQENKLPSNNKIRGSSSSAGDANNIRCKPIISNGAGVSLGHEMTALEILSRLPVKSLMRFKCVCKDWCSFIEDDPYFIDLHLTRSKAGRPGLFAAIPLNPSPFSDEVKEVFILSADLLFPKDCGGRPAAVVNTTRKTNPFHYNDILGPVNGLICFVDRPGCAVQIYNVSTREVTPWIESAVFMKQTRKPTAIICFRVYGEADLKYQFGFDPVTKEHKVVFVWRIITETEKDYEVCEVLTVGDNEWRTIDEYPQFPDAGCGFSAYAGCGSSVYANGSIYWYRGGNWGMDAFLVVFDVGSEKFRAIRISIDVYFDVVYLVGVDAGIAILRLIKTEDPLYPPYCLKMSIFDDYDKEENGTTSTTNSNGEKLWSNEATITLPLDLERKRRPMFFHPITGTDQIIIEIYTGEDEHQIWTTNIDLFRIYSYNWKTDTMTEVDIRGISSSIPTGEHSLSNLWRTFVESLLPVRKKLQHHGAQAN